MSEFLYRFNVAITRPKALLVIVGNPILLMQDKNWKSLLEYVKEHGGYTGGVRYPVPEDDDLRRLEAQLGNMGLAATEDTDEDKAAAGEDADATSALQLHVAPEWRADF